jgi:hypothetical protein
MKSFLLSIKRGSLMGARPLVWFLTFVVGLTTNFLAYSTTTADNKVAVDKSVNPIIDSVYFNSNTANDTESHPDKELSTSLTSTALGLTGTTQSPDYQPLVDFYTSTDGPRWGNHTNWLTGSSPCNWYGVTCNSSGRVIQIKLINNKLKGSIPAGLSALTSLQILDLTGNELSGSIPAGLSALKNLQDLSLSTNSLTGSIPSGLSALTNLQVLDLSLNGLSGGIPSSLSALSKLEALVLGYNHLSGSIPSSLSTLKNLKYLYLSNNELSGCFPASLSVFCGRTVDMSKNNHLPGGGDFRAFCATGAGSDSFTISAWANPKSVCVGNIVSLSVTPGYSYRWSGPAGYTAYSQSPSFTSQSPSQSGLYSVTATSSCGAKSTASVNLTVNALPNPSIIGLASEYCQNAAAVSLKGTPSGGVFTIDGKPATEFNPKNMKIDLQNGFAHSVRYSVTVNGCSAFKDQLVLIKPCSSGRLASSETLEMPLQVTVLGNPVNNSQVAIEVRGAGGQPLRLQLTDLTGQPISERLIEPAGELERATMSLSGQGAGLLLLRVVTPTQSQTVKLLKR